LSFDFSSGFRRLDRTASGEHSQKAENDTGDVGDVIQGG
jgi:hypothetical protein